MMSAYKLLKHVPERILVHPMQIIMESDGIELKMGGNNYGSKPSSE